MGPLKDQTDEELMTLYQRGEYAAFECLYERHSGRVFQYFKGKISVEAAKDLLQETFLKVHKSRGLYQAQFPFLPWLFTVARNSLNDFFRKGDQKFTTLGIDPESLPAREEASIVASEHDLAAVLSSLPHVQKRAIELRYMDDWSFEKIAEEMKTTPGGSRQNVSRGIRKIRSLLKGERK